MAATDGRGSSPRFSRVIFLTFVLFTIFIVYLFAGQDDHIPSCRQPTAPPIVTSHVPPLTLSKTKSPAGSLSHVWNSTLGFERVFVINLPERYDKLDSFTLASSLTGFSYDVIEGIKGSTIVNKTLPILKKLPEKETSRNSRVGCWRAHLNFAQKIVRERIQTALVMEDDADWDVSFKSQLADFATGSRYISDATSTPRSPYGDDWDLLWLGHCSAQQHPADQRRFVIENDDTVPPMSHRVNFNSVPPLNDLGYDNSTRIVFRANNGVCLYAYALSYRGAQKVLRWQNNVKELEPIDVQIGYQCRDDPTFKCIAVFPQLVDSHKSAGRASRDSDIGTYDPAQVREKGYTQNIVHSTRLNIDNLMNGEGVEAQWHDLPQVTMPRRTRFD